MKPELALLATRILLKCAQEPLSKSRVVLLYAPKFTKAQRDEAIASLMVHQLIAPKPMPKAGVKKTPTFYFITEKGQRWVERYYKDFPRQ